MKTVAIPILAALAGRAHADPEPHRLSVEQDPLAYLVHGWDVLVAYQHPALPHGRVTLGAFGADWPGIPDGFTDHITAVTTKLQYFPRAGGRGWMLGAQLTLAHEVYTADATPGHDSIDAFHIGAIAGYRWFPFGSGLFIYPWVRLGVSLPLRGDREIMIGDKRMTASWFDPVATFHLGYEIAL